MFTAKKRLLTAAASVWVILSILCELTTVHVQDLIMQLKNNSNVDLLIWITLDNFFSQVLLEAPCCSTGLFPLHCHCIHAHHVVLLQSQRHNTSSSPLPPYSHPRVNAASQRLNGILRLLKTFFTNLKNKLNLNAMFADWNELESVFLTGLN